MKYKRITREKAIEFLINSKTGTEPVWFKTNRKTDYNAKRIDAICVNGTWICVYAPTDAGKVYFKYDENGNKTDIYGYEECKVAYICNN